METTYALKETYALKIKATLDNLTDLQPSGGPDNGLPYFFKLKCKNCAAVKAKEVCIYAKTAKPLEYECKDCHFKGKVTMVPGHGHPITSSGKFATIMHFYCEGFEPLDFCFSGQWTAKSVVNQCFYDMVLTNKGFEQKEKEHKLMISDLEGTFELIKK